MQVNCHALHYYVIYIYFNIFPNLVLKYLVYHSLICCPNIFQLEWHDSVAICNSTDDKESVFPFLWCHSDWLYLDNIFIIVRRSS